MVSQYELYRLETVSESVFSSLLSSDETWKDAFEDMALIGKEILPSAEVFGHLNDKIEPVISVLSRLVGLN